MDPVAFDRLSRALATTPSRRTTLAGLAGALAGLLARFGAPPDTAAQPRICRPLGKPCFPARGLDCCHGVCRDGRCRCPGSSRPCRGRCLPRRKCCRDGDCQAGRVCRQGRCQCPAGKRRCGGRCIARTACCRDGECGAKSRCVNGRCRCAAGFKLCQGGCIAAAACCGGCSAGQACRGGSCEPGCGTPGIPCRVFVTSTKSTANLDGLTGADARCQARAQAAGLTGTYKAWLSDFNSTLNSPSTRFTNTANTGPYQLVNGTPIALNWAALTSTTATITLDNPINRDEFGNPLPAGDPDFELAWSMTAADGTLYVDPFDATCDDWHAAWGIENPGTTVGLTDNSNFRWTAGALALNCSNEFPLYCFEQG